MFVLFSGFIFYFFFSIVGVTIYLLFFKLELRPIKKLANNKVDAFNDLIYQNEKELNKIDKLFNSTKISGDEFTVT